jgi:Fe-S-cluster-containing dehydrogenase component
MPSTAGNGVMYKCDRCYNRLADGELPACIEACPENVQTIGPRDEIIKKAKANNLAAAMIAAPIAGIAAALSIKSGGQLFDNRV